MFVSKEKYVLELHNIEKAFLIEKSDNNLYLLADMEYAGDLEQARIEMMKFMLDKSSDLHREIVDCRGRYCGGISFIEYPENNDIAEKVIDDFLSLYPENQVQYVILEHGESYSKIKKSDDGLIYIYIK